MAGPGGGGRGGGGGFSGGGGFRGGSFGGGNHGGGFGGGPHRPHHHHHHIHMPFWGFGPWGYRYGYRGGCLGIFLAPIILLLMAAIILFAVVGSAFTTLGEGDVFIYDEEMLQDYANEQYYDVFANSDEMEENILIVFLTHENGTDYVYIGWVGDDVDRGINYMFGSDYTELGYAMQNNINTSGYWYSLTSNLTGVVEELTDRATDIYTPPVGAANASYPLSVIHNHTELQINEDKVNEALLEFSRATGYNIAITVEDAEAVFELSIGEKIVAIIIVVLFVGLAIFLIVKGVKSMKKRENIVNEAPSGSSPGSDSSSGGYYDDDGTFK